MEADVVPTDIQNDVDFHTSRPLQVREVESGAAVYNETEPPADRVGVPGDELLTVRLDTTLLLKTSQFLARTQLSA